jgi:hypothetical protein
VKGAPGAPLIHLLIALLCGAALVSGCSAGSGAAPVRASSDVAAARHFVGSIASRPGSTARTRAEVPVRVRAVPRRKPRSGMSSSRARFELELGLAAGTIERYVYGPYLAGTLNRGGERSVALVTAAQGASYAITQLGDAHIYAAGVRRLEPVAAAISSLVATVAAVRLTLVQARPAGPELAQLQAELAALRTLAGRDGYPLPPELGAVA